MSNLNSVVLQGNLVDNPKLMGEENNVARFTIAVNNGFGEHASTTYVDCVGFGKQATVIGEHLKKGKQVIVRGQLIQNRWETKEGEKRSKLEVRLENFGGFFFTGNSGGNGAADASEGEGEAVAAESTPAPKTKAGKAAASGDGKLF